MADWISGNNISLAALYILPMMVGAVVLKPWETALFAVACSYLRSWFDIPGTPADLALRFVFAALAYLASGLFVTALVRNHEQTARHLTEIRTEKARRSEAEEYLRVLAQSSPAAIFTVDGSGLVLAANAAANRLLLLSSDNPLQGRSIGSYLPFLAETLRKHNESLGLCTATQCQGHRDNGEIFLAHIWFSAYRTLEGKRLAAIVVDSSDEMRDREERGLDQLLTGNELVVAAMAHEVRNACEAMGMLCEDLDERYGLAHDRAFRGLDNLVSGLEVIASHELKSEIVDLMEEIPLREVLDNLRIVVEPAWREIEGTIRWHLPDDMPMVFAEPHGLLQAFLNLAQNSHRAVQEEAVRELSISVSSKEQKVFVRFHDSGPGIRDPESLFQPFQRAAAGSGLGLYVSRLIVRSYNGELSFERQPRGSCFVVELEQRRYDGALAS
ncbi:MAG TPA: HAMP domain-containing sensor histidine kinase [Bryobacteraceae bacterium]|nr:HAMP domain-containing sensor histidine kinase [Bryobacteraceae bacterium]